MPQEETFATTPYPVALGHEGAGIVKELVVVLPVSNLEIMLFFHSHIVVIVRIV